MFYARYIRNENCASRIFKIQITKNEEPGWICGSNYYYCREEESKERTLIKWTYSVRLFLFMVWLVLFRYRQFWWSGLISVNLSLLISTGRAAICAWIALCSILHVASFQAHVISMVVVMWTIWNKCGSLSFFLFQPTIINQISCYHWGAHYRSHGYMSPNFINIFHTCLKVLKCRVIVCKFTLSTG